MTSEEFPSKQLSLFDKDFINSDQLDLTIGSLKAREAEFRAKAELFSETTPRPELPPLILPRRYEVLMVEASLRKMPLRPIVKPVPDALTDIEREIRFVEETRMGRLYILSGVTGSGKTTFLKSLSLFLDNINIYDVKGIALDSRVSVETALAHLNRKSDEISLVVLEGRETPGSLKDDELDVLLTTLNEDFRGDYGRRTLFVIPTTMPALAQAISEKAAGIGGMTARERPFFVFQGPPRNQYIEIANETLGAFNESRTLLDYGVSDQLAKGLAEASESIGQYLDRCHQQIMEKRHQLETTASEVRHKRIHLWMVFCSAQEVMRRNYDIVRSLTIGDKQLAQVSRVLGGESKEVRYWQGREAEFALAASYSDLRLMYLPVRTALAIFTAYAPDELLTLLKQEELIKRESVRARAQESISNTALGAFLQNRGFIDDPSRRGRLDDRQKRLFQRIMAIAIKDETILNAMLAETLRDWIEDPEVVIATEKELDDKRNLITDIAIITPTDIYCLEMKWRSSELHDSEVIRETVARVTDFVRGLPELSNLFEAAL